MCHKGQSATGSRPSNSSTTSTEFHFCLDVAHVSQQPLLTAAKLVFVSEEDERYEVDMDREEAMVFTAVLHLRQASAYVYCYKLWRGKLCLEEEKKREVIPSRKRELALDKYDVHRK